jgi:hypothetical protein
MYIAIDDESDGLYLYGGASWEKKFFEATTASTGLTKVGFDVRLADAALSNGIQVSSGAISLGLATDPGLEFSSNALRVKIKAASGIVRDTDGLSVDLSVFDTGDLSEGSNLYFTEGRVLDTVLTGFSAAAGTVAATDTVLEALEKLQGSIDDLDASDISYTPAVLADWNSSTDPGDVDGALDQLAERVKDLEGSSSDVVAEVMTAGETLTASTLIAVRMAKGAETAGRVYKADNDASVSDDFYVIGLVIPGAEVTAGNPVSVVKLGRITATAHGFTVGAPIFLDAAGALTGTAPSAADEAVVRVGIARTANEIEVQPQVVGVN